MESASVVSSNIDRIGFHRNTLYIQFRSGESYRYDGTPYRVYQTLINAESVGSAFHRYVKGKYRYTRLECNPF